MMKNKKAVIIGSGFGGIASALRLNKIGFDVTLVERLDMLGGRARVFQKGGYRHDAGPTVITAPFLFEELFKLYNQNLKDHLNFVPLDPWYRFYFHNGKTFDYRPSIEDTNKEIEKLEKGMSFLGSIGSVAPFIGLLGTVWGIVNAFQSIAISNNTSLAVVAPGIAEALFATALGLLAAIPAVAAYNKFSNDLEKLSNNLEYFSIEFSNVLIRQVEEN